MTEAQRLKTAALCWLRFIKQMPYVATEVGSYSADVAGADLKILIEIEVKTNEADIRRDFQNKKAKHRSYSGERDPDWGSDRGIGRDWDAWVPNRFFYLVPARLEQYALDYLGQKNPKYGVMVFVESGQTRRLGDGIRIARKAEYIHREAVDRQTHVTFLKRMGSDLCHLHLTHEELQTTIDRVTALSKQCVDLREVVDDPA